jgi:hypothetical protein
MKKRLSSYTITPAAIVLVAVFVVAAVVAFVGAWPFNAIGLLVAISVLALPFVDQISGGRGGLSTKDLTIVAGNLLPSPDAP